MLPKKGSLVPVGKPLAVTTPLGIRKQALETMGWSQGYTPDPRNRLEFLPVVFLCMCPEYCTPRMPQCSSLERPRHRETK